MRKKVPAASRQALVFTRITPIYMSGLPPYSSRIFRIPDFRRNYIRK